VLCHWGYIFLINICHIMQYFFLAHFSHICHIKQYFHNLYTHHTALFSVLSTPTVSTGAHVHMRSKHSRHQVTTWVPHPPPRGTSHCARPFLVQHPACGPVRTGRGRGLGLDEAQDQDQARGQDLRRSFNTGRAHSEALWGAHTRPWHVCPCEIRERLPVVPSVPSF